MLDGILHLTALKHGASKRYWSACVSSSARVDSLNNGLAGTRATADRILAAAESYCLFE